MSIET